ncbi:MAG: hypothetical protein R3A47_06960 [Polyangiales bacterium]
MIRGYRNIYNYYDLFYLRKGAWRPKRLTFGLRATHPDVSGTANRLFT